MSRGIAFLSKSNVFLVGGISVANMLDVSKGV